MTPNTTNSNSTSALKFKRRTIQKLNTKAAGANKSMMKGNTTDTLTTIITI